MVIIMLNQVREHTYEGQLSSKQRERSLRSPGDCSTSSKRQSGTGKQMLASQADHNTMPVLEVFCCCFFKHKTSKKLGLRQNGYHLGLAIGPGRSGLQTCAETPDTD